MAEGARDDEREALIDRMRRASTAIYVATEAVVADDISTMLREAADLLARKHPEPEVTEEMVERAATAVGSADLPNWTWDQHLQSGLANEYRRMARAALEAAIRVPVGEGQQRGDDTR